MSYPNYSLLVFDYVQGKWITVANCGPDNRPHYYDHLRQAFDRLTNNARESASPNQKPIGYMIVKHTTGSQWIEVDRWDNGKIA